MDIYTLMINAEIDDPVKEQAEYNIQLAKKFGLQLLVPSIGI
jgi:hypothetical protein